MITFRTIFATVGGVVGSTLICAALKAVDQVLLVGEAEVRDKLAEILAIHFELFVAAFGILYSAEKVAPTKLAGPLAHGYRWLILAGAFAVVCVLIGGVFLPQRFSDASIVSWLLRVVLPDLAAIGILIHAALTAQRVERSVRQHVDL